MRTQTCEHMGNTYICHSVRRVVGGTVGCIPTWARTYMYSVESVQCWVCTVCIVKCVQYMCTAERGRGYIVGSMRNSTTGIVIHQ